MSSAGCSCAAAGSGESDSGDGAQGWEASSVGRHLSSCMLGPFASSSSLLNEWLLLRTLQLAGELPDPLPRPPPVQYAMVLPSLQLMSFIVCRAAGSTSAHTPLSRYNQAARDVLLVVRDCSRKRVWRMRECYGPRQTETETRSANSHSSSDDHATQSSTHPSPLPFSHAADDRFHAALLSSRLQPDTEVTAVASSVATSVSTADIPSVFTSPPVAVTSVTAAPSSSGAPSFSSNLRTAIAAARAKSPAFASSLASSSHRQSTWKVAPQPFGLFDAWGEAQAWLGNQQHSGEHEQYTRCIHEQAVVCSHQPLQTPPKPLNRPSVEVGLDDSGHGWSELHALLHHLGFFSSLLPTHALLSASSLFPYPLPSTAFELTPSAATPSGPSLLLLHSSKALTSSIDELDAISDTQLHRVMLLTRRPQQSSEWEMMANRGGELNEQQQPDVKPATMHDGQENMEAFSSLLTSLPELSSRAGQSEQLMWFVPSRLCPLLLSDAASDPSSSSAEPTRPAVWTQLLSACAVRVVWCEGDADYVSPHRQRQRERKQRRRARETGEEDGVAAAADVSESPVHSSPRVSPRGVVLALPASSQPQCAPALVYVVVSFHPADASYRLRVDCDWRLRNQPRRIKQQQLSQGRSQSHSNAIISASSAGGTSLSSRWLPPPLVKSNSLTNAHPQPPSSSSFESAASSSGTVFKSLFKRLGSRSARASGQADHLSASSGQASAVASRTSSLSPARSTSTSASLFASRRSPRRGDATKHDGDVGSAPHSTQPHHFQQQQQQAERRRSERADALRRHPVLSQPFPPSDCSAASVDALAARLSDTVLLSARRVAAWREWRTASRRLQHVEAANRHGRRHFGDEHAEPWKVSSGAAELAMHERSRLLREMIREHGELVTPAAFFETMFGSLTSI